MTAMALKQVPCLSGYQGNTRPWESVLYEHCLTLGMSHNDKSCVRVVLMQAKQARAIPAAAADAIAKSIDIRVDLENKNQFSLQSIFQLLKREFLGDGRMHDALNCRIMQKLAALINVIEGCIFDDAGLAQSWYSPGDPCALMNSIIFGMTESMTDFRNMDQPVWILQFSAMLLKADSCSKMPAENRKALDTARKGLAVAVDELRRNRATAGVLLD